MLILTWFEQFWSRIALATPSCSNDLSVTLKVIWSAHVQITMSGLLRSLEKMRLKIQDACNLDHYAQLMTKSAGKHINAFSVHVSL